MYYRTLFEDDENTPFHNNPIQLEKFVKHFKEKAKEHEVNRLKDQPEHRCVPQDKTANQTEQKAPSPGEKGKG